MNARRLEADVRARTAPLEPGRSRGARSSLVVLSGAIAALLTACATGTDIGQGAVGSLENPDAEARESERGGAARAGAESRYLVATHKPNYVVPFSATTDLNEAEYEDNGRPIDGLAQPVEVNFQISLKSRLNGADLLFAGDALELGLTIESWWQLYAESLSSPFRETNYQPEIFYTVPTGRRLFGADLDARLGFEHQSNGQVQGLSRSWNRLYLELLFERGDFLLALRPWYRLPEDSKRFPLDPEGDDNPDIEDYFGSADLRIGWRDGEREHLVLVRGNPSTGKGAIDASVAFPLFGRLRGYASYFAGYGDSLIDYDHHQQRIGLGLSLSGLY